MTSKLDKQLCDKYPKIFKNRRSSPGNDSLMRFGFECGDGWYHLLDCLCNALTYTYESSTDLRLDGRPVPEGLSWKDPSHGSYYWPYKGCPQIVADQVKEKFGGLRFYYHFEYDEEFLKMAELYPNTAEMIRKIQHNYTNGIVHAFEAASYMTCEITGLPGIMHIGGGWMRTLNPEHAANHLISDRKFVPYVHAPAIERVDEKTGSVPDLEEPNKSEEVEKSVPVVKMEVETVEIVAKSESEPAPKAKRKRAKKASDKASQ